MKTGFTYLMLLAISAIVACGAISASATTANIITNTTTSVTTTSISTTTIPVNSTNKCNTLVKVYVGHNLTCSQFTVVLTGIGQANSNGILAADVKIYNANNVLIGIAAISPKTTKSITYGNYILSIHVNQTFAGLYTYQKWAQISLHTQRLHK